MYVLGVESSCDECSFAIVKDGRDIISHKVFTQMCFHDKFGGVVPEFASRLHIEYIEGVYRDCINESKVKEDAIDGIVATAFPGLFGSLLVGHSFAKALSYSLKVPFAGVNHILAHVYSPKIEFEIEYPYIALVVSGGHTILAKADSYKEVSLIGETQDDSIGEAFDKISKYFGLGYPGGQKIDFLAQGANDCAFAFPRPSFHKSKGKFYFSYSGLKNAVINQRKRFYRAGEGKLEDILASFQKVAVDEVLDKLFLAMEEYNINRAAIGGGVAKNSYLRARVLDFCKKSSAKVFFPSSELCTDNAAMVAGIGYHYLKDGLTSSIESYPSSKFSLLPTIE